MDSRLTGNVAPHEASLLANQQALFYSDSMGGAHIPVTLLREVLLDDLTTRRAPPPMSTVLALPGGLLLHAGGRHRDNIVLRYASAMTAHNSRPQPGFTVAVGGGSPLLQILSAGGCRPAGEDFILARSGSEVFFLRTAPLADAMGRGFSLSATSTALQPVQKWQLPLEVADMAAAPSGCGWSYASLVTHCGAVMRWTPTEGVVACNGSRSIVPASALLGAAQEDSASLRVECSLHPQVSYLSYRQSVLLYDARSSGPATSLCAAQGKEGDSTAVRCLKQHAQSQHQLLVSRHNALQLMDVRYMQSPLTERGTPDGHTALRFCPMGISQRTGNQALVLGGSAHGSQILAHTLDQTAPGVTLPRQSLMHILGAAGVHGCSDTRTAWSVDGFPVVDVSDAAESRGPTLCRPVSLTGFDLVCAAVPDSDSTSDCESDENDGDRSGDEHASRAERLLLVQQSSVGDLFAQPVSWGPNPWASRGREIPAALRKRLKGSAKGEGGNEPAPVQLGLPAGIRAQSAVGSNGSTRRTRTEQGRSLRCSLLASDLEAHTYPIASGAVVQYVPEDSAQGCDVLRVVARDVRTDLPSLSVRRDTVVQAPAPPLEEAEEVEEVLARGAAEKLLEAVALVNRVTMWEAWVVVQRETGRRVDLPALCAYLRDSTDLVEDSVASGEQQPMLEGLVRARVGDADSTESQKARGCSCNLDQQTQHSSSSSSSSSHSDPVLQCCGEDGCLAPHLVTFRLSRAAATQQQSSVQQRTGLHLPAQFCCDDLEDSEEEGVDSAADSRAKLDLRSTAGKLARAASQSATSQATSGEDADDDGVSALFPITQEAAATSVTQSPRKRRRHGASDVTVDLITALSAHWDSLDDDDDDAWR